MAFNANTLLTPAAILIAGAMVSGAIVWSNQNVIEATRMAIAQSAQMMGPGAAGESAAQNADIAKVSMENTPFVGSANAPVAMAYWFDYQCPFCKQNELTSIARLVEDYVKPGKLMILFKDFAFLGPDSITAGIAARAVWEAAPQHFYEWNRAMFEKQDDENGGWGNKADILALTKTIPGIDAAKVEELMNSKASQYQQAMDFSAGEGQKMGINGTPGAIIGKKLIVGAAPYEQFKSAIEAELAGR